MSDFDLRMLIGPSLLIVGGLMLHIAWRLWRGHPLNRVITLGPFVTEAGLKWVVETRLTFFAFGSFLSVYGLAGVVFWFARRQVNDPVVSFLGALAAGLGIWAALLAIIAWVRLWRIA